MVAAGVNPLVIFTFLTAPFQWVLEQLTNAFSAVSVLSAIGSFGLAVIVLTIAIRGVLFPVFAWQLKNTRRIQAEQRRIGPQLQELRKKYKGQPQKLSAEMNKLYHEHGISPFSGLSGCLPLLVQMPVLIGLYNAIRQATQHIENAHKGFLWISDLSKSAVNNGKFDQILSHPAFLILPAAAAVLTFAQSRMMMPPLRPDMSDQERSMANISKQMSVFFPLMIAFFGLTFPQGLALYWVTGTIFMVVQQYLVVGWGGLHVPAWVPGADRTTALSYPKPALGGAKPVKQAAALAGDGQFAANGGKNTSAAAPAGGGGPVRAASVATRSQSRQARARARRKRRR
jgi:YidC/Oxa1 family membrane protein insertase